MRVSVERSYFWGLVMDKNDLEVASAVVTAIVGVIGVIAAIYFGFASSNSKSGQKSGSKMPEDDKLPSPTDKNISTARLPITGGELFGREGELARISAAWENPCEHVLCLEAAGGVGKTSLVAQWLGDFGKTDYGNAQMVFVWSFYSQGSSEKQGASADLFINEALIFFGQPIHAGESPWTRGERLANAVKAQKALLILDGMEPLQYPPGPLAGRIKDPALAALIKELAAHNPGLCIITTREEVDDIKPLHATTAPIVNLNHLPPEAGAELLKDLGVKGSAEELQTASTEMQGHALALTLLGTYLRDACDGDVRRRAEVHLLDGDTSDVHHAHKVMRSYETWLNKTNPEDMQILRLTGLFDRPARGELITVLRGKPVINGINDHLVDLGDAQWNQALARLRRAHLLVTADASDALALDAHPLVREYNALQLQETNPDGWQAAHGRLYDYLCEDTEEFPDTLDGLAPLYEAVAHGCKAGRYQDAFNDVYAARICRGNVFFATKKLGAYGADLAALAHFFAVPWSRPAAELSDVAQAVALGLAGFNLRAMGRMAEASEPMQAAVDRCAEAEEWQQAAVAAGNHSELQLLGGDIAAAAASAAQALDFARKSEKQEQIMKRLTTLATTYHQAGDVPEAARLFAEAEELQRERQPQCPYLYSLRGFQYCGLLLDQRKWAEVQDRAKYGLEIAKDNNWLLDIALDSISLGRTALLAAAGGDDWTGAEKLLTEAVEGLLQAGHEDYILLGLLARAELWRHKKENFPKAEKDLADVLASAKRMGTRLLEADACLGFAWLRKAEKKEPEARDYLERARKLIDDTGYHRRDGELAELDAALG